MGHPRPGQLEKWRLMTWAGHVERQARILDRTRSFCVGEAGETGEALEVSTEQV